VVGPLLIGFFAGVVCAYACTEILLTQLDSRRQILDRGVRSLAVVLAANIASFAIIWGAGIAITLATGFSHYLEVTLACVCAQAVWLGQHLWSYYRDHPRLNQER
jgi:hypothetical protein